MTAAEPSSYHHGDLRRTLIDAAMRALADKPAHELSLRELAREAGVSRTAPYHHFDDKSALIRAVAEEAQDRFYTAQATAARQHKNVLDGLVATGEAYIDYAVDHPHAYALVFDAEYCPAAAGSTAQPSSAMTAAMEGLQALVELAQAQGVLPGSTPLPHMDALWGLAHGLSSLVASGLLTRQAATDALNASLGPHHAR